MAPEKKRGAKTQSLSLRLDPKTKFTLDFVARIRGQSITTVVERAIKDASAGVVIDEDEYGNRYNWSDFWDPNEGMRTLKLLAAKEYPTTFDEDELRSFTLTHWVFFYKDPNGTGPRQHYLEILWLSIDRYMDIWRETKIADYWAAGKAMCDDLSAAKVAPPEWPPEPKPKKKITADLDDEIPF